MYVVFRCRKCGRYLYAREGIKKKICVCGHSNDMRKVVIVKKVEDERKAGEIVRALQGSGTSFKPMGG